MQKTKLSSGVVFLQKTNDMKISQSRELRKNMTEAERILWKQLRNRNFKGLKFRRQQIIEGFIVDFFCQECKLVIEADGLIHSNSDQIKKDMQKDAVLTARSLRVLRITNDEIINNVEKVLQRIDNFIFLK